jgi:hypothetical protein
MKPKLILFVIILIGLWINQGCMTVINGGHSPDTLKRFIGITGDLAIGYGLGYNSDHSSKDNRSRGLGIGLGILLIDGIFDLSNGFSIGGGWNYINNTNHDLEFLSAMDRRTFVSKPDFIRHYELISLPNITKEVTFTTVSKP